MNYKECGRISDGLILCSYPDIFLEGLRKAMKSSVMISSLQTNI